MDADFNYFFDTLLLHVADGQNGSRVIAFQAEDACRAVNPDAPPTWIRMAEERFRSLGYGRVVSDGDGRRHLKIGSAGISRASEIRKERAPKPLADRLSSSRSQGLLNFGAFGVSIISLIVAIVALFKATN